MHKMSITYTILNESAIMFNKDDNKVPFLVQTSWPNGQKWTNPKDMNSWAKLKVAEIEDENAPLAPAGPGLTGKNKINKNDLENALKALSEANSHESYVSAKAALKDLHS